MEDNEKNSNYSKASDKLKEITDMLEKGIKELFNSDTYKVYLKTMSKFTNYSVNNTLLIAIQKPDATLVAGYNAWQTKFGRHVNRGAKAIKILAPAIYKKKELVEKLDPTTQKPVTDLYGNTIMEEVEVKLPYFKTAYVFDVSQTSGKELPQLGIDELTGNVDSYNKFFDALKAVSPMPIDFIDIKTLSTSASQKPTSGRPPFLAVRDAKGYCNHSTKRIAIQEGMSQIRNLKTAIHEISYAKLHDIELNARNSDASKLKDRQTKEVEAESIAFTVCQHYGIDTSEYSFPYIATWSENKELPELNASLQLIRDTAADFISQIDEQLQLQEKHRNEQEQQFEKTMQLETTLTELPSDISIDDMYKYGYSYENMLPLDYETAKNLFENDFPVYALHADNTESLISSLDELEEFDGMFGIEKQDWTEASVQRASSVEHDMNKEAEFIFGNTNGFAIYQLGDSDDLRNIRFESLKGIGGAENVDKHNYYMMYSDTVDIDELDNEDVTYDILNQIYEQFNIDQPEDFKGHSLSVSDVIVLKCNDELTAFYVDSFGFEPIPDFYSSEVKNIEWDKSGKNFSDKKHTLDNEDYELLYAVYADKQRPQQQTDIEDLVINGNATSSKNRTNKQPKAKKQSVYKRLEENKARANAASKKRPDNKKQEREV